MLTAQVGHRMGPSAISDALYGGLVLACAAASMTSPFALHGLLAKWPESVGEGGIEGVAWTAAA
ncbi:MAG: hypothetical protein R2748_04380 [Bryobacterales bacterium]